MSSNDEFPPLIDRGHPDFWMNHIDPDEGYDDGADDDLSTIDGGGRWVNGIFYCAPPYPPENMRPNRVNPFLPVAVRLTDIDAEALTWIWPGWIPAGVLTILGGYVGDGKSTAMAALVAALTSGAPLPDGTTVPPINVLILGVEDDPARVLRPASSPMAPMPAASSCSIPTPACVRTCTGMPTGSATSSSRTRSVSSSSIPSPASSAAPTAPARAISATSSNHCCASSSTPASPSSASCASARAAPSADPPRALSAPRPSPPSPAPSS